MKTLTILVSGIIIALLIHDPSEEYWAKVGWEMDRTLNPCKYTNCATSATEISP